ncbi:MAG: ferritin-like domain-containing protein [Gemmatimonadaceae bacterium]
MHDTTHEDVGMGLRRGEEELTALVQESRRTGRRMFIRWAGVSVAGVALAACSDSTSPVAPATATPGSSPVTSPSATATGDAIDLGSGDIGILNYAFALEQLESAFYTQVIKNRYSGMSTEEYSILNDVRKHENIHSKFLAQALGSAGIPFLSVDFSSVDFTSRTSVLTTAMAFEDVGVSAYNGAGQLLETDDYLMVAGKIVSVEARHASAIRDLLRPKTGYYAGDDVVGPQGLDVVRTPAEVLSIVYPTFIKTAVNASHLPTT